MSGGFLDQGCYTLEAWGSPLGCEKHFEHRWLVSGEPKKAQPVVRQCRASSSTALKPPTLSSWSVFPSSSVELTANLETWWLEPGSDESR